MGERESTTKFCYRVCMGFVLACLTGCGRGDAAAVAEAVAVRDSAGVRIVENAAPAWSAGEAWRIASEPRVEIGEVEGERAYLFDGVVDAARLSDGRIAVLDAGSGEVRLYSADGVHVRSVGGLGGGPGEFARPEHLVVTAGDSLRVWDVGIGPIATFDPEGDFIREDAIDVAAVLDAVGSEYATERLTALPNGAFILHISRREFDGPEGELYRPPLGFVLVSRDLTNTTLLGWYRGIPQLYMIVGGRRIAASALIRRYSYATGGGDPLRIAVGDSDQFDIHEFDASGRLLAITRRNAELVPVPDERLEAERQRTLQFGERMGFRGGMERVLAALPPETHFPAFRWLYVDRNGCLWADREGEGWVVFDRSGRWLGAVDPPSDVVPFDIGSDYVLGVHRDSLGIDRVRLYGLDRLDSC